MIKVKENLTSKRFGRLLVVKQVDDQILPCGQHVAMWLCKCDCSDETIIVSGRRLREGHTQSCGCLRRELSSKRLKKYNKYNLSGEYGIGWTTNTNQEFYFDLEDYDKIKDYCWIEHIISGSNYRALETHDSKNKKTIRMHYLIVGKYYDHINLNTMDNRKENLRIATKNQNAQNHSLRQDNTSGFSGVTWDNRTGKWVAQIDVNKKHIYLGHYESKQDALISRLNAELKYFGLDFAPQRHLFEKYKITNKENVTE